MKVILTITLILTLCCLISTQGYSQQTDTIKSDTTKTEQVYVTDTGTKYHKSGCRYLNKSKHTKTLTKAIKDDYTACSKCYGKKAVPKTTKSVSQCMAATKAGTRCKRKPAEGSAYCWQH
jgi:hypothetical protein